MMLELFINDIYCLQSQEMTSSMLKSSSSGFTSAVGGEARHVFASTSTGSTSESTGGGNCNTDVVPNSSIHDKSNNPTEPVNIYDYKIKLV